MAKTKAALLYQAYRTQLLFEENKRALNDPAGYGRIWQGGGLHAGSNASGTSAPQSFSPSSSFFSLLYGASILFAPAFTNSPIAGIFAKQKTAAKKQREKGKEKKKQQAP